MIAFIQALTLSVYAHQDIIKQDIGTVSLLSPSDVTRITSSFPKAFLIGKFNSYPIFELNSKDNTWITNCEFCDFEDWDLSTPELLIFKESWKNSTLYVSALYTDEGSANTLDITLQVEDFYFPYCPQNCSHKGSCKKFCECEKDFTGHACSTPVNTFQVGDHVRGEVPGFSWKFFLTELEKPEDFIHLEFEKFSSWGLHIYLNPSNRTKNFPSVSSYRTHIAFPEKKDMFTRYFIHEKFLLWSFFCSQRGSCEFSVGIKAKHSDMKKIVGIFAISTGSVIASIGLCYLVILGYKKLRNRFYMPLDDERIIAKSEMEACFPKHLKDGREAEVNVCCICLAEFGDRDSARTLGCVHSFHAGCIDQWTAEHTECPLCKKTIFLSQGRRASRRLTI